MTREEAIRIIEANCSCTDSTLMEACAMFIPELRESYDERVRKNIVATIEQCPDDFLSPKNRDRMLTWLEKQKEQKPAEWSEEDEMLMDELESYILYDKEFNDEQKSWRIKRLKSLRPQPKAEWSEEDEKQLDDIISIIRGAYEHGITISETRHRNAYFWLNNLRPSWKPSEEQMEELLNVISYIERPSSNFLGVPALLESLYEQLQKVIGYGSARQNLS